MRGSLYPAIFDSIPRRCFPNVVLVLSPPFRRRYCLVELILAVDSDLVLGAVIDGGYAGTRYDLRAAYRS